MALIHNDEVEELRRNARVVHDVRRRALPGFRGIETRSFFVGGVELRLPFEHRIETLDGCDNDFGCRIDRVGFQSLQGIEHWKLAWVVWRLEVGEFVLGLL